MQYFLNLVVSGVAIGALYGLVAMGFAVIYKTSRVLNFAQGEIMMLIAYTAYSISASTGGSTAAVLASVLISSVAMGYVIERIIIRPMLGQPVFSIVMMTIALAILIKAVVGLIWGVDPRQFPGALGSGATLKVLGVPLAIPQLALIATYLATAAGTWLFLRFHVAGIAVRATASDPTVAMLMGASTVRLYRLAWVLSAAMAGMAGVLFSMINSLGYEISDVGIRSFPAAILGGLDSVVGAGFAGVLIGVVENLVGGFLGSAFKEVAGFAVILVVLMIRPYGLFGQKEIERV